MGSIQRRWLTHLKLRHLGYPQSLRNKLLASLGFKPRVPLVAEKPLSKKQQAKRLSKIKKCFKRGTPILAVAEWALPSVGGGAGVHAERMDVRSFLVRSGKILEVKNSGYEGFPDLYLVRFERDSRLRLPSGHGTSATERMMHLRQLFTSRKAALALAAQLNDNLLYFEERRLIRAREAYLATVVGMHQVEGQYNHE